MNKIYKVIWSKARNCYVVVSELAKRNGKCSSSLNKKIIAAFLAAGMTIPLSVSAAGYVPQGNTSGIYSVAVGSYATANGWSAIAVGNNAIAKGDQAVAVGNTATTGRNATSAEARIGAYNALQETIKADAAFENVAAVQNAKTYAALVSALNSVGTAAANSYRNQLNDLVTTLQNQAPSSTNAIAVGNNATAGGTSAIAVGNAATALKEDGTAAHYAIAVGNSAKARNTNAIAIGSGDSFTPYGLSTAILSGAWGEYDIAIGLAAAHGERVSATTGTIKDGGGYFAEGGTGKALAIGWRAQAMRANTIALGKEAMATGENATAIGHGARALTPGSVVIGGQGNGSAGVQQGNLNTALDTIERGGYSIAIGTNAMNFTTSYNSTDNYFANTKNSISIGHFAHTHAAYAFAIGVSTDATAERSFAIGTTSTNIDREHTGARAGGQGSLTFGDQAVVGVKKPSENTREEERGGHVLVNDAMAMGTNSWAQARNAVALGGGMSYTYHDTSADGKIKTMTNITKYYDGSQKKWVDIAEGTGAHVGLNADGGVAIGGATGTVDLNGSESHWPTTTPGAVSGYTAAASISDNATRAIAIGSGSVIGDDAENSVAVGARNIVTGVNSTAVGAGEGDAAADSKKYANMVTANGSAVFGNKNKIGKQEFKDVEKEVEINGSKIKVLQPKVLQPDTTTTDVFVVGGNNEIAKNSGKATYIGVFGSTNKIEGGGSTNSTMIGNSNEVTNKLTNSLVAGNSNTGLNQVTDSQIIGNSNTAIGTDVSNLVVLGNSTTATGGISSAIAIGQGTTIGANNAIAMGTAASVSVENGVALGSSSVAARDKANGGAGAGYDVVTGTNYAGTGAGSATWVSTLAAISVGGDSSNAAIGQATTATRQLTGLAAGTADTDAVNVAQLKRVASSVNAVNLKFNANAGGVKSNASGSTVNVVGTTAKSGHTYSADNVTTEITQDDSGNSTITIKMDENPSFSSVTTGNTKIDSNGLAISGGPSVTKTNVTMAGQQIHNVAAGSSPTDAVNLNQLNKTAEQLQWRIGITDDGGTNGTKNKDGAFTKALEPSLVGNVDGVDKSNVQFIAGNGIDISNTELKDKNGYGVKISSKFIKLKPTIEGGHFAGSIVYEGDDGKPHEYFLTGGGASAVDVISDKRAAVAEAVTKESKDADGNKVYNHAIEIFTPYIEISGTEDAKEKDFAKASGDNAIALGHQAEAAAENTIAMGHNADAKSEASTAIGYNSHAHGPGSVSIGVAATTSGNRAIAIGTTARNVEDVNYETSNPHQGARAAGQGSIVLGDRARALSQEYQGTDERIGTPDTAVNDAIAVGTRAEVRARNAIAIGGNSSYSYTDKDTGKLMTVYGNAGGRQVGAVVGAEAYSGIAIGGAYGSFDENTKTINEEMSAAATYGIRGIAIGSGALVANPDDFRDLQKALSDKTYISYKKAFEESRSNYLAALSAWNAIKDITPNDPSMPYSMRVTKEEKAAAESRYNSTKEAMTKATANYSMALKEVVRLQQKDSVLETDAIAIGTQANASVRDSIALGSKSVTNTDDRAGVRTGISGYDPLSETSDNDYFRGGMVGGTKYEEDDPVWRSTAGSLSVGGGTTTVTNADGEEVKVTVTRRISNVAAGVSDSDAVNVAQLKRATTFSTDSRNTTLGVDEEGKMSISSPYLNIKGVGATAEHTSIIKRYKTAEAYKASLDEEEKEIAGRIASINKTRSLINDSLKTLEADYKAQKISEADYRLHKLEYDDQLTATSYRLDDLNASLKEIKAKSANAATVFAEAKDYYDSQANASGTDSIAIGNKAASGGKDSITLGQNNRIGTAGAIDADADTDLEKEGARSIAIGSNNTITGTKETDSSTDSIAIGTGNTVSNKESIVMGKGNTVTGEQSLAIGTGHTIKGNRSGAIGDPSAIDTDDSWAIGNSNTITGNQSFILGNNSTADKENTFIIGSKVTTTAANSVFLGNDTAYVAAGTRTAGLRTDYTGDTFNGNTYKYAGGDQTVGVVSVGNKNETRRIQNVAPGLVGPESTDAINGSQLYSAMSNVNNNVTNLGNQITNVDSRARKGIAGAAALAALHPLEFDPDDKLTFAAGMGHYRGENAAALGLFYRPDEKVMFSLGGTVGNGENMVNAGVSFSLDRTPRVTGSRTALTKEVVHLREQVARQDAQIAKQNQQIAMQGAQIAQLTALVSQLTGVPVAVPSVPQVAAPTPFPDNLDNKWAYDVIEDLEQRGYFTGYAGRELTRDEFAAALDRAMAGGAKLEERIIREFEPELSHVRVAHVEGKGNNEGEWYERPRASHDKYENKHEIAKKYSRVQEKKVTSKS